MVTQSFVGFRWTELNSITRPGMSEFDARLTTKRCNKMPCKRVCITLESSSHVATESCIIRKFLIWLPARCFWSSFRFVLVCKNSIGYNIPSMIIVRIRTRNTISQVGIINRYTLLPIIIVISSPLWFKCIVLKIITTVFTLLLSLHNIYKLGI